jgi:hypothetical protein
MFTGMIEREEVDQLFKQDISTMDGKESLAALDLLDRYQRQIRREFLHLLEAHPKVVAQHPQLQDELDYLRTLDLGEVGEVSGPGS